MSNCENNFDDEPEETLSERLWGLTEMFPEPIRNAGGKISSIISTSFRKSYNFACQATWIFLTSSIILFAPVVFELERTQLQEMQNVQQKEILLGPGHVKPGPPQVR